MSTPAGGFEVHVERIAGFEFRVRFDKPQFEDVLVDEPPPLGQDHGPNATRLLAAAVGNCLAASLLFCSKKAGVELEGMRADVLVHLARNEQRRLRIGWLDVTLVPLVPVGAALGEECLRTFEDFCVVTQSVRQGLDVRVAVRPETSSS